MGTLLDLASLVVVPSGYKEDVVYSVKPTDGSGDLSFTRSNDTATRVNSAGLIEKVRTNLLLQSEAFDNAAWTKQNLSVTVNASAAPNGTTTADKIIPNSTLGFHPIGQGLSGVVSGSEYAFSVYAKADGYNFLLINTSAGAAVNGGPIIDLSNGTIVGTLNSTDYGAQVTSVGSGWYRINFSYITNSTSTTVDLNILPTSTIATYSGNGTSGVLLWGAQFEVGVATDYIPTTTAAVSVGMTANVPRLDYSGGGCPKLLLEPQRTNVNIYSESFGLSGSLTLATATYNTTTSPDGYVSADSFLDTSDNNIHALLNVFAKAPSPVTYTYSLFVKAKDSGMKIQLSMDDAAVGGGDSGIFNPSTGAFITNMATPTAGYTNPSRSVTSYGNGWYRISFTITTSTATFNRYNAFLINASNSTVYAGTGTGVYVWGAQMEVGAYATSYIPTLGAAVTRGADACSKTGISSLIGSAFTLFADITKLEDVGPTRYLVAKGAGSTYQNFISFEKNSDGVLMVVTDGSATTVVAIQSGTYAVGQRMKIAGRLQNGSYALYINGAQIGTATTAFTPSVSSLDLHYFDYYGNNATNQVLVLPSALTNTQLQELTTI